MPEQELRVESGNGDPRVKFLGVWVTNPDALCMASTSSTLLTVGEVAARLRCSISLIYKLVDARVLPCTRIGNAIRIDQADLAEYLVHTQREAARCAGTAS